ncbi:MAG: hypothetical protein ABW133_10125 [Polyangiaceae bacterium]
MITRIFASRSRAAFALAFALATLGPGAVLRAEVAPPAPTGSSAPRRVPAADDEERRFTSWLADLTSREASSRAAAVQAIDRASPLMLQAIAERLTHLSRTADKAAMSGLVATVVRPQRVPPDEIAGRLPDGGFGKDDDWLVLVMSHAAPDSAPWRELTAVLGLSRMLTQIGSTTAARHLAALYPAFGDFLRPDLERQLVTIGVRSLPALIEMRRAEAKEQRVFALKLLEALGKAIPGDAVQAGDDALVAEVLVAYGKAREVDAARVVLTFANSDRRPLRDAARTSIAAMGEAGFPALREAYENFMSKKVAESSGWESVSRDLFAAFDRARLTEAYALMDEGTSAFSRNDVEGAANAFDRALARDPAFPRRAEMAPAFLALGRSLKKDAPDRARAALRKAMRVDPTGPLAKAAESELLVLEARALSTRGIVDEGSLRRAMTLDPENADAKNELSRLEAASSARSGRFSWYAYGGVALLLAIAGLATAIAHGRKSNG